MQLRFRGRGAVPKNLLAALAASFVLYLIVGFGLVPLALDLGLAGQIESRLGLRASLEDARFNPLLFRVEFSGFTLATGEGKELASVDQLRLDIDVSGLLDSVLVWREITLERPVVHLAIAEDGRIDLPELLADPDEEADADADDAEAGGDSGLPMRIVALVIEDGRLEITDRSRTPAHHLSLDPIDLDVRQLRLGREGGTDSLALLLGLPGAGELRISGGFDLVDESAQLDVEIRGFDLRQLQPLVREASGAEIRSGTFATEGRLRFDSSAVPMIGYEGAARIAGLVVVDGSNGSDVVRLTSGRAEDLALASSPSALSIGRLVLAEPYLRVAIAEDGTTNLERLARPADSAPQPDSEPTGGAQTADPFDLRIGAIVIEKGSAWFEDRSLEPAFATRIEKLEGGLRGFELSDDARLVLSLSGETGPKAPMRAEGELLPFSSEPKLDLALTFRNLDLTTFTPYSGRFAGYQIEKGRMDMDLSYQLDGNRLVGSNQLLLDELTLGPRVDSADATTLPIQLGLALLEGPDGRIELDLEVIGDVSDPDFNAAGLLWKAFVDLLQESAARPLALLGSLVGGRSLPEEITFEPGRSELGARQATELGALARALTSRPALELVVRGTALSSVDARALASRKIEEQLIAEHEKQTGVALDAGSRVLSREEREQALRTLHRRRRESRAASTPAPASADGDAADRMLPEMVRMERDLMSSTVVFAEDLGALADARTNAVREYLIEIEGLPEDRSRIGESSVQSSGAKEVPFAALSLEVRD